MIRRYDFGNGTAVSRKSKPQLPLPFERRLSILKPLPETRLSFQGLYGVKSLLDLERQKIR